MGESDTSGSVILGDTVQQPSVQIVAMIVLGRLCQPKSTIQPQQSRCASTALVAVNCLFHLVFRARCGFSELVAHHLLSLTVPL